MPTGWPGSSEEIQGATRGWPGVTAGPHRFGGIEFRFGKRELGHLHGDAWADIPFPKAIRNALVEAGEAQPHHVLPESGWVSLPIRSAADVSKVIELLRRSYDLAQARRGQPIPE